ncbi:hypothetical protein ANCDUO_06275 [Ancylostoma duodenale]|uniref:C2H2-type domain-containing protein n=1 Tax=Ancylostoma duodenale TaxID=51022 RepID=A0A0C2D240_9BILA|nr:hypothetical protein ANCDUO_06275 [Ancylostoma duodenale]
MSSDHFGNLDDRNFGKGKEDVEINLQNWGLKPYHCANCGSSFYARARFAVHLSKYHRISIRDYSRVSRLLKRPILTNDNEE